MMKPIVTALVFIVVVLTVAPVPAQITGSSMGHTVEAEDAGSGPYNNVSGDVALMWQHTVEANSPGVPWIRIHFDEFDIGWTDFVRLTSVDDPTCTYDVQGRDVWPRFAHHGIEVEYFSLFFNGDAVEVGLYAQPGSSRDGVHIDSIHVGMPDSAAHRGHCTVDPGEAHDNRVGRLIAYKDYPLASGHHYIICSATLLFPGSCVLAADRCFYDVALTSDNVIVEFDVPHSLGGSKAVQHPAPEDQFRLRVDSPCAGSLEYSRNPVVFALRPNEKTGCSPGRTYGEPWWFSGPQLVEPADGDSIMLRGYFEQDISVLNYVLMEDMNVEPPHTVRNVEGDGVFSYDCLHIGYGNEGGPVLDRGFGFEEETGRLVYGIHTDHDPLACIAHLGISFRAADIDPRSETSCIYQVCNQRGEYQTMWHQLGWREHMSAAMTLILPPYTLALDLRGTFFERGGAPVLSGDNFFEIDTEIVELTLTAMSSLGPVEVSLNAAEPSQGLIVQADSLDLYPADAYYDLFLEIRVGDMLLYNEVPIHMTSSINSIPAYDDQYAGAAPPGITLYEQGAPVGTLLDFTFEPHPQPDCVLSGAILETDVFGTLPGSGPVETQCDASEWDQAAMNWQTGTEITMMDIEGVGGTGVGEFIVRQSTTFPSLGTVSFPFAPDDFPAESFFDVFLEIEFPGLALIVYNEYPFRVEATVNGFPPIGDTYQGLGSVELLDMVTGQPVGMLLGMSLSPEESISCTHSEPWAGVGDRKVRVPAVRLFVLTPNPARGSVSVAFDLGPDAMTQLRVYDVAGRTVRTLAERRLAGGTRHEFTWDGTDDAGRETAPGIYFVRLGVHGRTFTRKVVLVR